MIYRLLCLILLIYALLIGGTYRGILLPDLRLFSLLLLTMVVAGWAVIRRRNRWRWHETPLDVVLPLWIVAFVLSLLFNMDASRRILLALWYMGLYIGLWYIIHDILANRAISPQVLVNAILISGLIVVLTGYVELLQVAATPGRSLLQHRPHSMIGNPITLATFLMVIMLATMGQISVTQRRELRAGLIIYLLAAGFLLFLTDSRGIWLGLTGAIIAGGLLIASNRGLSPATFAGWWQQQSRNQRLGFSSAVVLLVIVGALVVLRLVQSFVSGRGDSGRIELYQAGLAMFTESPLAGKGLFTFGRHTGVYFSLPPDNIFQHSHNIMINVAGELGLVGLVALGFSLYLLIRWLWKQRTNLTHYSAIGSTAVIGLGIIHLFDLPSTNPAVALLALLALILMVQPQQAPVIRATRGIRLRSWGVGGLGIVLLLTGYWDSILYAQYLNILGSGFANERYAETAAALQFATDADPTLLTYPSQQAFLWGVAAANGDDRAAKSAIDAYRHAIALEPYYAPYHANLAALYWHSGQQQDGLSMMQQAASMADDEWTLHFNAGEYAEALGDQQAATAAYEQALQANPDADLHPAWPQSRLRATLHSPFEMHTPEAQIILLLEDGQINEAIELWDSTYAIRPSTSPVIRSLLALAANQRDEAQMWYEHAQELIADPLWLGLNEVHLARFDGDTGTAQQVLAAIQQEIENQNHPLAADYINGANIAFYHYFRQTIPAQFLPQVFYPHHSILFLHLLGETDTS